MEGDLAETPMQENREGKHNNFKGRDHTLPKGIHDLMAGAGIKKGGSYGETDESDYSAISAK
jgi:hypothetical protein